MCLLPLFLLQPLSLITAAVSWGSYGWEWSVAGLSVHAHTHTPTVDWTSRWGEIMTRRHSLHSRRHSCPRACAEHSRTPTRSPPLSVHSCTSGAVHLHAWTIFLFIILSRTRISGFSHVNLFPMKSQMLWLYPSPTDWFVGPALWLSFTHFRFHVFCVAAHLTHRLRVGISLFLCMVFMRFISDSVAQDGMCSPLLLWAVLTDTFQDFYFPTLLAMFPWSSLHFWDCCNFAWESFWPR